MNVAPVAPTPSPARAADAPSPAAAAFGDLLWTTPTASGAPTGSGDPAELAPAPTGDPATSANEPAPIPPAAIKAPVADHLPMPPATHDDCPVALPAAPLAQANPDQPADAIAPATPAITKPAATALATPTPAPALAANAIASRALPWQSVTADDPVAPTPPGGGDDDAHEAVGAGKPKSAKADSAPAVSSGTQQPQPVVLTATPAATAIQPPSLAPRQDGDGATVVTASTGGGATLTAAQSTPRDTVATAPAGTDNLPPLLASQTPGAAIAAPAGQTPAYTPVSAPQAAPVVVAEPGQMGRDIGVEIARHVAAGRDEVMIRLAPAEMGRIDVRLSFDDKGALHAAVSADSPQALHMLRRDAGDLGRSLADAGIRTDSSSFSFDSRDSGAGQFAQQQHGHPGGDGRPLHRGAQLRDADGSETSPVPYRQLRAGGRVDLMA